MNTMGSKHAREKRERERERGERGVMLGCRRQDYLSSTETFFTSPRVYMCARARFTRLSGNDTE